MHAATPSSSMRLRASRTPTSPANSRHRSRPSSARTPTRDLFKAWIGPRGLRDPASRTGTSAPAAATASSRRLPRQDAYGFRGVFHTVRENELIIQTFEYEGTPDEVSIDIIRFEELPGGRSRIVDHSVFPSASKCSRP